MGVGALEERTDALRKQVSFSTAYCVLNILFAVVFGIALILIVVNNQNTNYQHARWILVLCAIAGCAVLYVLQWGLNLLPAIKPALEWVLAGALFVLLAVVQINIGWSFGVEPDTSWSFGSAFYAAQNHVVNGQSPGNYFLYSPHDIGLYGVWCLFFTIVRSFGVSNFILAAMQLNTVAIYVAVVLLYFSVRYTFGSTRAILTLLMCFVLSPLCLYLPLFCGESLSLPFVVAMLLLWQKARKNWRSGDGYKTTTHFCVLSLLGALGVFIYPLIILVWCGIALDLLLFLRGKGRLRILFGGLALLAVILSGLHLVMQQSTMLPAYDYKNNGIPLVHWICAGLGESTDSYAADFAVITSLPDKAARSAADIAGIKHWYENNGFWGLIAHFGNKLSLVFGDGTYGAPGAIYAAHAQGGLASSIAPHQGGYQPLAYISFASQAALLFWSVCSAVKAAFRRNDYFSFARVPLFFLALFCIIWQASARNVLPFLPLLVLCAIEGVPSKRKKKMTQRRAAKKGKPALAGQANPVPQQAPPAPEPPAATPEEQAVPPQAEVPEYGVSPFLQPGQGAMPFSFGESTEAQAQQPPQYAPLWDAAPLAWDAAPPAWDGAPPAGDTAPPVWDAAPPAWDAAPPAWDGAPPAWDATLPAQQQAEPFPKRYEEAASLYGAQNVDAPPAQAEAEPADFAMPQQVELTGTFTVHSLENGNLGIQPVVPVVPYPPVVVQPVYTPYPVMPPVAYPPAPMPPEDAQGQPAAGTPIQYTPPPNAFVGQNWYGQPPAPVPQTPQQQQKMPETTQAEQSLWDIALNNTSENGPVRGPF